jgi:hypothetical protein
MKRNRPIIIWILSVFLSVCANSYGEFLVYPTENELVDVNIPENAFRCSPLSTEKINASFSNHEDLSWLGKEIAGKRVLFFGEFHNICESNQLFERILFRLANKNGLRGIILEMPFSFSGPFNFYITEPDNVKAEEVYSKYLKYIVMSEGTERLLGNLRKWNLSNPGEKISLCGNDIELYHRISMRRFLAPFLIKADPDFKIPGSISGMEEVETLYKSVGTLLDKAGREGITGDFPFENPEYMRNVLRNLCDSLKCLFTQDEEKQSIIRQHAIIRNMTDSQFNRKIFDCPLVLINGGAWHAVKAPQDNDAEGCREAEFLNSHFAATKGKVFTLRVENISTNMEKFRHFDMDGYFTHNFFSFIPEFQKAVSDGKIKPNFDFLFFGIVEEETVGNPLFSKIIAKLGYKAGQNCFILESVDWESLTSAFNAPELSGVQKTLSLYDKTIIILKTSFETPKVDQNN